MKFNHLIVGAALAALSACQCDDPNVNDADVPAPIVNLLADTNRDGVADKNDEADDEDTWSQARGAIFLANLDLDTAHCPANGTDVELPACHDASDDIINGDEDLLDTAPLYVSPWKKAPSNAVGYVVPDDVSAPYVRLFRAPAGTDPTEAEAWEFFDPDNDTLSAADLKAGVRFRLEGKDLVRDRELWDGLVTVSLFVTTNGGQANTWDGGADYAGLTQSDAVQLRISPLMTFSHLTPTETLYATMIPNDPDSVEFRTDLQTALNTANIAAPLVSLNTPGFFPDQWTQDFFETGYMMMPGVGGPHTMKVFIRSANVYEPQDEANPLREAGKLVFTQLRGADSAGLQQFERGASAEATLDSFGNYETIPPYSHQGVDYPLGRQLRGNVPSFHPDTSFTRMMEAQAVQPPVYVDTSWLLVAHIDETVSFIPVDSPRGWALLVNDPRLAKTILEAQVDAGNGAALMFPGMNTWGGSRRNPMLIPASRTIDQVLADTAVMGESLSSALEVDAQLAIIQAATGLTEAEIIRVPFLHEPVGGGSLAYQPGTVNGVLLTDKVFASPDPHGPVIDGKDIFKTQLENALAPFGVSVAWVEDWYLYHINAGEVHCGSNSMRAIPEARWWESGR